MNRGINDGKDLPRDILEVRPTHFKPDRNPIETRSRPDFHRRTPTYPYACNRVGAAMVTSGSSFRHRVTLKPAVNPSSRQQIIGFLCLFVVYGRPVPLIATIVSRFFFFFFT